MRSPRATTRGSPSVSEDPTQPKELISKIKKREVCAPGPVPLGNPVTYFLDTVPKSGLTLFTYGSSDKDHQLALPPSCTLLSRLCLPHILSYLPPGFCPTSQMSRWTPHRSPCTQHGQSTWQCNQVAILSQTSNGPHCQSPDSWSKGPASWSFFFLPIPGTQNLCTPQLLSALFHFSAVHCISFPVTAGTGHYELVA